MAEMVLINITIQRGYQMKLRNGGDERLISAGLTTCLVKCDFAEALPELLVENATRLRLEPDMSTEDIQVRVHVTEVNSPDAPNLRIYAQLTERPTLEANRFTVGDELYKIIVEWFTRWPGEFIPERFVVEIP